MNTDMSGGMPFSRSTFRRHREEVENMFGIRIYCDADNKYYIDKPLFMHTDSVSRWMLSTLSVSNLVSEARGLHNRILLETIPTEGEHLSMVVEAMRTSHRIKVKYRRYGHDTMKEWTIEPYCIKLFRRRWYLLCRFPKKEEEGKPLSMVLSFDRILEIDITEEDFKIDEDFDAQDYFAAYFGVMVDDSTEIQTIVLRAYGNERFAMRDLPIHPSQREVAVGDDYIDFIVRLHPTSDFFAHILSRGRWIKVLSPHDTVQKVQTMLQEAVDGYLE